jgi:hypothetical protein
VKFRLSYETQCAGFLGASGGRGVTYSEFVRTTERARCIRRWRCSSGCDYNGEEKVSITEAIVLSNGTDSRGTCLCVVGICFLRGRASKASKDGVTGASWAANQAVVHGRDYVIQMLCSCRGLRSYGKIVYSMCCGRDVEIELYVLLAYGVDQG